jgi:hypothetical protein
MDKCEPPKCEYSIFHQKCIKPNPYIERLSYCNRKQISKKDCKYDITIASKKACKYHKERIALIKERKKPIKEPKEHKEHKERKKPIKEPKEHKERKKPIKEPKEHKERKKPIKEPKERKERKKPIKELIKELIKESNEGKEPKKLIKIPNKVKKLNNSDILKNKEKELEDIRIQINEIIEKLGSTDINSVDEKRKSSSTFKKLSSKPNDIILIEEFEKELNIELEHLDKLLGKKEDSNSSLIYFLKNRTKTNIADRIKYYDIIHSYIKKIKDDVNCFNIYKNDDLDTGKEYRIGDNIILDKKIGDDSKYGITFISHFKNKSNNKLGRYLIFATKLTDFTRKGNLVEYQILKYLTKLNINNICPHFPIGYGKLLCKNSQKNIIKENLMSKKEILGSNLYNISHIFIFNELADGSLKQFYKNGLLQTDSNIENMTIQCIMSIMFFNKYINAYHNDCHYGNFLYHNVTPGGYYYYNIYGIDYYIKNNGYLWVIWDYGLIVPYYNSYDINKNMFGSFSNKILPIITDYKRFISIFSKLKYYKPFIKNILSHFNSYEYVTDINNIKNFTIELLNILVLYSNEIKTSINSNKSNIINKVPYIIN